jgi:carbamoyl-phosphate synthase large subunit
MGGQTALNLALELERRGVLSRLGIELIGANARAIELAESRELFKGVLDRARVAYPRSATARTLDQALGIAEFVGFPCIVRASFTLGGTGASIVRNRDEFIREAQRGLEASPASEVLVEESVLGWKEYELEVVRDKADNVIIVCSIENIDPMGVHTGDSITVAPAQTLTDREYQRMRDAAIRIIREVGVDTGGSNIQFAVHPKDGRMVAIEMNPRVSRSSALASKATGFPIARIAAKLAVGYRLDELPNDITRKTLACFEPTIDYVVTKIPRFAFEKFPRSDSTLSPSMKSVGEVMAIGSTFNESLQKALRSLENRLWGLVPVAERRRVRRDAGWAMGIREYVKTAKPDRLLWVGQALREHIPVDELAVATGIDRWFLDRIEELVGLEREMAEVGLEAASAEHFRRWKRSGFSDRAIAHWTKSDAKAVRERRLARGVRPVYRIVDTCAAEFVSATPYCYSTYESEDDPLPTTAKQKVVILGSGPNRIGQGIEFDYCCVQASMALREEGVESVMVNCNPETVSTDYDTSDRLYFEPLFLEDLLPILEREKPLGVIVHFGGQTPLNLSRELAEYDVPLLGTSAEAIALAEDRERFRALCEKLGIRQPESRTVTDREEALGVAQSLGFPLMARPSYVLGGGGMEIVYSERDFNRWLLRGHEVSAEAPLLLDRFLERAIEVDVDAVSDGDEVIVCGILEQVQEAGVHSGDSASVLPPATLSAKTCAEIERQTKALALALGVRGLLNVQFAVLRQPSGDDELFVLEANPRASRTVPFISKAAGIPFAKIATKVMLGKKLRDLAVPRPAPQLYYVKESVFPFSRFTDTDTVLGPEMRSTGEVMGVGATVAEAFGKAQIAAGQRMPTEGSAFLSVRNEDKEMLVGVAAMLREAGLSLVATRGTAAFLEKQGFAVEVVNKVNEGRPHCVDKIRDGSIHLVVNTSALGVHEIGAAYELRRATLLGGVCYFTTLTAARAAAAAILELQRVPVVTHCLQDRPVSR